MKLHDFSMTNWRSFYGTPPVIHFAIREEDNVTVIHAANGSGKTNFLNALLWLFSGTTSPNFQRPDQLINKQAILDAQPGSKVECEVACTFEHHGRSHRATRSASCTREETVDKSWASMREYPLRLMVQTDSGGWEPAPSPQDMIDAVLPPSIRDFFFFDGEELRAKFRHDKKRQDDLAKQMQAFFGLNTFVRAQREITKAERELRKQTSKAGDDALEKLNADKDRLEEEKQSAQADKAGADDNASFYATKMDLIEKKLEEDKASAALQGERQDLKTRLASCDTSLQRNRRARAREIAQYGYSVFLSKPLATLDKQIDELHSRGELPSEIKRPFLERLLTTDTCICGRPLDADSSERSEVESWLARSGLSDVEERVLRMSSQFAQLSHDCDSFWEKLGELQTERQTLKHTLHSINARLEQIGTDLSTSTDEEIQELEQQRQELQDKRETEIERSGRFQQRVESLEDDIREKQAEIDVYESRNDEAERARRRQVVASEAATCIEKMFKARDAQVRTDLLDRIAKRYRELTIKQYEPRLSEEYRLEIVDPSGDSESVVGLSGGETQVLAFCFVGSIIEIQREHAQSQGLVPTGVNATEYPIVMDSPYGQLGSAYRKTVSDYVPEVTDQVIVLVTDTQWDGAAAGVLRDKIGRSYVMKQHATLESLGKHQESSVTLNGREYPFVMPSTTGYEWTEVLEVVDG